MTNIPAFIIGAARSGSGKTTLTLGLVAALVRRGLQVQCFKCGPDFIDPTLHRAITSRNSYNLDLRMMGAECCRRTYTEKSSGADIAVVEGVMGLFDGGDASTAALAKVLSLPVLLVVDAGSAAESAAAVVQGFQHFDSELNIRHVVFNNIGSSRHRQLIHQAVTKHCSLDYAGYFGRDLKYRIPERHLGLHMGSEQPLGQEGLDYLVAAVEESLDVDTITALCPQVRDEQQNGDSLQNPVLGNGQKRRFRLGLALDEAFCFYYPQNLELFEQRGFEIVRFSPIHDRKLPVGLDMLYIGGGYPESYALALSRNRSMLDEISAAHKSNLPIYAECGGFMYLCGSLVDMDGKAHRMAGIFPFKAIMNKRLRRLGYRRATLAEDCLLGTRGDVVRGHEFHYSHVDVDDKDSEIQQKCDNLYVLDNNSHEGYSVGSALGSYVHLHFGDSVSVIDHIHKKLAEIDTHNNDHD